MAHVLRINRNSVLTDLTSGNYVTAEYTPNTAPAAVGERGSGLRDGGERVLTTRRNTYEQIRILIRPGTGEDMSDVQEAYWALYRLLKQAETYQEKKAGYPVYLEFQPEDAPSVWRSEILGGDLILEDGAMNRWAIGQAVKATLVIHRRFYWEGPETELGLATIAVTKTTGGVGIHNHYDAPTYGNYVEIDGDDIDGAFPAPLRLEILSTYATDSTYRVYVGSTPWANPASWIHSLEAENAVGKTGTSDATCSNGEYVIQSVSTSDTLLFRWALTAAQVAAFGGRKYRVMARIRSLSLDIRLRVKVTFPTGTPLTVVDDAGETLVSRTGDLQDLGEIQIPPWLPGDANVGAIDVSLYGYLDIGGPTNLGLDCLFLMPADTFETLIPIGYGFSNGLTLIDDETIRSLYVKDGSGKRYGYYTKYGLPPMVYPGEDLRIHFLTTGATSGSAPILQTHTIRAYYRPRRLSI